MLENNLDPQRKAELKARLISRINSKPLSRWQIFVQCFLNIRFVSGVLSGVFGVVLLVIFMHDSPEIQARSLSFIIPNEVGEVDLKRAWEDDFKVINLKTRLEVGDIIRTNSMGGAKLKFFDDTVVLMTPNTEILIQKLKIHPTLAKSGVIDLQLVRGYIWNQVVNLPDQFSKLIVQTKDSVISTEEATFLVQHAKSKTTDIATLEDSVYVTFVNFAEKQIIAKREVPAGYQTKVSMGTVELELIDKEITNNKWVQDSIRDEKEYSEVVFDQAEDGLKDLAEGVTETVKLLASNSGLIIADELNEEPTIQVIVSKPVFKRSQKTTPKEFVIRRQEREARFISKKADEIIKSINTYKSDLAQRKQVLNELRELSQEKRFKGYHEAVLKSIQNRVPIKTRHLINAELSYFDK